MENKQIIEVPRELLERVAQPLTAKSDQDQFMAMQELRTLLSNAVHCECLICGSQNEIPAAVWACTSKVERQCFLCRAPITWSRPAE